MTYWMARLNQLSDTNLEIGEEKYYVYGVAVEEIDKDKDLDKAGHRNYFCDRCVKHFAKDLPKPVKYRLSIKRINYRDYNKLDDDVELINPPPNHVKSVLLREANAVSPTYNYKF